MKRSNRTVMKKGRRFLGRLGMTLVAILILSYVTYHLYSVGAFVAHLAK